MHLYFIGRVRVSRTNNLFRWRATKNAMIELSMPYCRCGGLVFWWISVVAPTNGVDWWILWWYHFFKTTCVLVPQIFKVCLLVRGIFDTVLALNLQWKYSLFKQTMVMVNFCELLLETLFILFISAWPPSEFNDIKF